MRLPPISAALQFICRRVPTRRVFGTCVQGATGSAVHAGNMGLWHIKCTCKSTLMFGAALLRTQKLPILLITAPKVFPPSRLYSCLPFLCNGFIRPPQIAAVCDLLQRLRLCFLAFQKRRDSLRHQTPWIFLATYRGIFVCACAHEGESYYIQTLFSKKYSQCWNGAISPLLMQLQVV